MASIRALHVAADTALSAWDKADDARRELRTVESKVALTDAENHAQRILNARSVASERLREAAWAYYVTATLSHYDALIAAALAAHATDHPEDRTIAMEAALHELWSLALKQPEFTGFCDEVVVTARKALTGEA